MFDADRPITSNNQDRLNRTLFAKYLARCLLDHHEPESLVVGLYGGWGVGKTSVINLMIEELNFASSNMSEEEKPIILNFSPWSYSGQNHLIYNFFRRLSSVLRKVPDFPNSKRIIYLLELYVSFFTQKPIPKSLQKNPSFWQRLTFTNREDVYGWESGRDLTQVKAELNDLLRQQKHKIIIVIDNISRLSEVEIKQIFQIVKSMGDYVNTAYILAFDKQQIIQALNRIGEDGEEFVNKIVQLPFEIPPILQQDLENILSDRLSNVIATVPPDAWNSEYWADIYYHSLKYFFENCRDITHYVNTLNFSYPRLRDVVNPVDFFALTAIEVFLPKVYFGIRDNKDLFTDLLDNVYKFDQKQIKEDRLRCNEIISRVDRMSPAALLELLLRLFPRLRHIYQPELPYFHSDTIARKLRRICSSDLFDIYFRLSMQPAQIPQREFEIILAMASDAKAFDQALTRLNQDDRIIKFLDQLDSRNLEFVPQENISSIVDALIDNGDLFPQGTGGLLSLDTPMRIHRIIHVLLQRFSQAQERFLILQNAIGKANKSLYIIVHELEEQAREHMDEADTFLPLEFRDLTPDQLTLLQKLAVARIETWALNGSLAEHPKLLPILYAWNEWSNEENCHRFIIDMTKTDKGLVTFLRSVFDKPIMQAITQYEKKAEWQNDFSNMEKLIASKMLEERAKKIFEDEYFEKLNEKDQLAVMIFLDLSKAATIKVIPQTSP